MTVDLYNPQQIAKYLRQHGLKPQQSLGQNFLINPEVIQTIVENSDLQANTHVLEIGPGLGTLTAALLEANARITALEVDIQLAELLPGHPHLEVINTSALQYQPTEKYSLVANIPYYITGKILRHYLAECEYKPNLVVLMTQLEVAEKIAAKPGEWSLPALLAAIYGEAQIVCRVPASDFYPEPQVDSAVLKLIPKPYSLVSDPKDIMWMAKAGFSRKRKQLRNALKGGLAISDEEINGLLKRSDIDGQRRAETLELEEWDRLTVAHKQLS